MAGRYIRRVFWLAFAHWERVQVGMALVTAVAAICLFVFFGDQSEPLWGRVVFGGFIGLAVYFVLSLVFIAPYQAWAAAQKRVDELDQQPVLQVRGPFERQAKVDTNQLPLWYVVIENPQPRSIARNVRVRMDNPVPHITMSFPIELHRMHDNNKPFTKAHDIRYGEPLTFDLLACGQVNPEMYYLYRADGDEASQEGPEWMLSEDDNLVISAAIHESEGWRFDVIATPDPPALPAHKSLCLKWDSAKNWPSLVAC